MIPATLVAARWPAAGRLGRLLRANEGAHEQSIHLFREALIVQLRLVQKLAGILCTVDASWFHVDAVEPCTMQFLPVCRLVQRAGHAAHSQLHAATDGVRDVAP